MKQRGDLNNLLHTASKEINHDTLNSIQSLETLESLQQAQEILKDGKEMESADFTQNLKKDSIITHLRQGHLSKCAANNTKNPYKDSIQSTKNMQNVDINIDEPKKTIYVSVGDINGIGIELILRNHSDISKRCVPIYCIDKSVLYNAAELLHLKVPDDMILVPINMDDTEITPGVVCAASGYYSFMSFCKAVELSVDNNAALVTLPINKYAWRLAGIKYAGHTQYLRERFKKEAIMMLGCESMFVALYTDHIPLCMVANRIQREPLLKFFRDFYHSYNNLFATGITLVNKNEVEAKSESNIEGLEITANVVKQHAINAKMAKRLLFDMPNTSNMQTHNREKYTADSKIISRESVKKPLKIAVLGLNPHAGDNGVLGHEDMIINECIKHINNELGEEIFVGTFAPDSAFTPSNRKLYRIFIAMYHDSGLAPLKALYFDKSINVSLNLPILRTSPDHGTCFDKAYKLNLDINMDSYLESFKFILQS